MDVELASANIIEIIGKPLIYLIICLQTIIYNSIDFKRYYLLFLFKLNKELMRNGLVNSYIFNNSRIQEFNNSVDLRIKNEINMKNIKDKVKNWSDQFKKERDNSYKGPIIAPLQYIREKERKKKNK